MPIITRIGNATSIWVGKKMEQMIYSPMYPPPGTPDIPTDESTATKTISGSDDHSTGCPNTPQTKMIFSTQEKQEPSMCIVAPRGITISATSLLMPVSSATSRLVGIVATDEQVPRDTTAGRVMCWNIVLMPCFPPPNHAKRGNAVKM